MIKKTTKQFCADTESLKKIYKWTSDWCQATRLKKNILDALLLSVYEAASNQVEHGFKNIEGHGYFTVTLVRSPKAAIALFEDNDQPFDINSIPTPDLSVSIKNRKIGGLGVHFVKSVMDKVYSRRKKDFSNQLVMIKYMHPIGQTI